MKCEYLMLSELTIEEQEKALAEWKLYVCSLAADEN